MPTLPTPVKLVAWAVMALAASLMPASATCSALAESPARPPAAAQPELGGDQQRDDQDGDDHDDHHRHGDAAPIVGEPAAPGVEDWSGGHRRSYLALRSESVLVKVSGCCPPW